MERGQVVLQNTPNSLILNTGIAMYDDVAKINDLPKTINLRNVIVHGYASIENETIWGILQNDLPALHEQVRKLLDEKNNG